MVSDTHMPYRARDLPPRLVRELQNCHGILHAGDWTDWSVYERFAAYAPTEGVAGNNDGGEIVRRLGLRKVLEAGGCRIGIVHGHGGLSRKDTEANALRAFRGEKLDAIIYGHTHIPVRKTLDGVLVFNPGSPTDRRSSPKFSFGVLQIRNRKIELAEHIFYDKKKLMP